ncbi:MULTISPECIES: hypothetical protein [unclassified Streptomyces]|uniref:hypothetical protein n=1 Tax=unclassified Streptomyces TaxID=2593676 RepID=UPI0014892080|nr:MULTISPECIES: hypothetical protein [unclassified Streptomyces]
MNRIRLTLHRLFRRPAITGPYRLYIRRTPTGALLDVEHYLTAVLETLVDNPDLLDLLMEFAEDRGQARQHDGWEPEQLLAEKLCTALGYELPLYGREVEALADRLRAVAPAAAAVSAPRREGGAAA